MHRSWISAAVILSTAVSLVSGQDSSNVYFSFIVSNGEYGYRSSGAVPSIDIALEAVQDLQILPGYNLTYETVRNSKVCLAITMYVSVPAASNSVLATTNFCASMTMAV